MKKKIEHVAIIMDGNGRWAKKNRFKVFNGHKEGVERLDDVIKGAIENDIKYLTIYAFSKENWQRSQEEVNGLLKLIEIFYKDKLNKILENGIKVSILGDREEIPKSTLKLMDDIVEKTKNNNRLNFNIAFNYSSQDEIVSAVNLFIEENPNKKISKEDIESNLYTKGMPDVDLLIRTSGEQRISNFLLWQISYSELVFTDVLWPDFKKEEFKKCIEEYYLRDRRFGKR